MEIKEYNHAIPFTGKTNLHFLEENAERLVPYKGASVLAVQKRTFNDLYVPNAFVIVPGRVLLREGNISRVEPIIDRKEREELTKILEEMNFNGRINFW
ncbi:MAG TPA: hypothetical protein VJG31_02100 [Candidatus Nanoarchaeia archaeon]|nr:hypothetical protein [Candidatus Nanoarchaeia archaeon]